MPAENPKRESSEEDTPYEIKLGVPFKPFETTCCFCRSGEGNKPFLVPEAYDHILVLRRQISFYGITGVIDVITEDPGCLLDLLTIGINGTEKPLGETHFESTYYGPGREEFTERPCILRFSFLVKNPSEYSKLLVSYADVKLGKDLYLLTWNQNRPSVKSNMQFLEESGNPLLVVEKNLFNDKNTSEDPITEDDKNGFETKDFGRDTFIWLPKKLESLQTIELAFNQFDGGDGKEQPTEPIEPEKDRVPVLV